MEANQYLNDFYNHYDEDSRLLFQHGSVEFLTTMRYIEKYLKHGDKVLEIGAGTGRYSHALARRGHPVDAVELVAHNIEVFRQNTRPGESVTIAQGNALDLSAFADNAYDVTLLLGPLYHLYTQDDKRRALREAIRVTKPGGVVFAAYVISDGCLLDEGFRRGNISVAEYVRDGLLDARTFAASSQPKDLFELVRKEDVDELMSVFPVTRLHYVASDGCALLLRDEIDAMDADSFALYLTSAGRCGRRSASQSRAALSLPLMSSPTAAFWTRASAAAISLLPNMCGTGCWTPGRLPPAPSQRICSSWCAKRMLMS